MGRFSRRLVAATLSAGLFVVHARAQQAQTDSSTIAPDGTAYVTRVVPVPTTVSPEAQKLLARVVSDAAKPATLQERRTGTDKWQTGAGEAFKKIYP